MKAYHWEDFNIGDKFETQSIKIDPGMVEKFSKLSGDDNPNHINPELAKDSIYKGTIVQGMFILSLFTGQNRKLGILKGTSMGVIHVDWDFKKPVYVNDTIYFKMEVIEKRETSKPDRGLLKRKITTCSQDGRVLSTGYFLNLVKRR
jgi:acyl dehydratase